MSARIHEHHEHRACAACNLRESEPFARLCCVCADEIAEHALASEEDAVGCGCLDCARLREIAARVGVTADELTSLDVVVRACRALRPRFELVPPANDSECEDDDLRNTLADEARDAWVEHLDAHADVWPEVAPMPWERDWTDADAMVGVAS